MYIDTHAHLTDKAFDEDRKEVVRLCKEKGVQAIINSGVNLASSKASVAFAKEEEIVYSSIGVYPEYISQLDDVVIDELARLAEEQKVVAIGEIGLQFTEGMPSRIQQEEGFLRQLELACELKLPVVIHCREGYGEILNLLKNNKPLLKYGGTFHCYSGSLEMAREFIKLGFHISVGGVSTFNNASKVKEVVKNLPLERILLETDCPYLAPHPFRGKRNAPFYLEVIAENLARLKDISLEEVARQSTQNAKELFKI